MRWQYNFNSAFHFTIFLNNSGFSLVVHLRQFLVDVHEDVSVPGVVVTPNHLFVGGSHDGVVVTEPAPFVKPVQRQNNPTYLD